MIIAECLRRGIPTEVITKKSKYDAWFVMEIKEIVETEIILKKNKFNLDYYLKAKSEGFSDEKILKIIKSLNRF